VLYVPKPSNKATIALITSVVGDTRRAENWSRRDLTAACLDDVRLDPHNTITVSYYFLLATPPVIVDMEPAPALSKFYCDKKRAWAHANGIVYLPIFLRDKLTRTQFEERLKDERKQLVDASRLAHEVKALKRARKPQKPAHAGYTISMPEVQTLIDTETMLRIEIEEKAGLKLRGAAKATRIEKLRREVESEYLSRVRDGSVGHQLRRQQPAVAAGG
jgi:hypothetical protein